MFSTALMCIRDTDTYVRVSWLDTSEKMTAVPDNFGHLLSVTEVHYRVPYVLLVCRLLA